MLNNKKYFGDNFMGKKSKCTEEEKVSVKRIFRILVESYKVTSADLIINF